MKRSNSLLDRVLIELQHGLKTTHSTPPAGPRSYPAQTIQHRQMEPTEQNKVAGLMRVNNAGEVAAQGLYRGQALTARDSSVKASMQHAADEENEHLNWCQQRLGELNASRSIFDGLWYWGSFSIGALAGAAGDKWSLGFVKETEDQVYQHLEEHLQRLPDEDERSRLILQTMKADEQQHAKNAADAGAAELPLAIKSTMKVVAKIMTTTAYRL